MWKPGTRRPPNKESASSSNENGEGLASNNNNKSPPAIKKLSSGTMNMRFMQRTSISPKQIRQQRQQHSPVQANTGAAATHAMEAERADDDSSVNDNDNNDEPLSPFVAATAQDMYGTVLMGRRSLGGFRPMVEQIHAQSLRSIEARGNRRKRKRSKT